MVPRDGRYGCVLHLSWYVSTVSYSCFLAFANGDKVLDPNVKLAYAEDKWDAENLDEGVSRLEEVV